MQNKKCLLFIGIIFILLIGLFTNVSMAKELDLIDKYYIRVDPRKDGTLDINYDIEWEVLDSTTEGPLTWVKIGIPNANVSNIKATTSNIKKIAYMKDHGNYVRIDFDRPYNKGEVVNFKFKIHQGHMYEMKNDKINYKFTPGWFKNIHVEDMKIFWNASDVIKSNSNQREGGYLVWRKGLKSNEKISAKVEYEKDFFTKLNMDEMKSIRDEKVNDGEISIFKKMEYGVFAIIFLLIILSVLISIIMPGSYRAHRGFGYGGSTYHSSSYHSHCACVSSCACACACAGGGRAGCSRKDFYGTRLKSSSLNKVLNEKNKNKK